MLFSRLASFFERLEATSSRLSLIEILSELFKEIKTAKEIQEICYLVQGRVAPFFASTEIGMAEKTVAQSIAVAYNTEREEVLMEFDRKGDMGLAVLEFAKHHKSTADPTVTDVFEILTKIAGTSGDGTVEKKITLLSDVLKKVDSLSAKFLVRIPLANLRLGIGDPTVLDALATVRLGGKQERHYLEGAYNRTSDLGLIARTLWDASNPVKAVSAVEKLDITVGNPIRSELCERLPSAEKVIEKMGTVDAQYKYDGFRVQIHKNGI